MYNKFWEKKGPYRLSEKSLEYQRMVGVYGTDQKKAWRFQNGIIYSIASQCFNGRTPSCIHTVERDEKELQNGTGQLRR